MSMNADEISELDGDFDREKEVQLDRRNEAVENYMTIEFVAIPPDFEILAYLSLREQAGIFKTEFVNVTLQPADNGGTNGGNGGDGDGDNGIPGFELIQLFVATLIVIFYLRRKRSR